MSICAVPVPKPSLSQVIRLSRWSCHVVKLKLSTACAPATSTWKWFSVEELPHMSRKELQSLCKRFGIRATAKTTTLIQELENFHSSHLSDPNSVLHYPFASTSKTKTGKIREDAMKSTASRTSGSVIALPSNCNRTLPVLTSVESIDFWVSSKFQKLCKTLRARGTRTATDTGHTVSRELSPVDSSVDNSLIVIPDHGTFLPTKASVTTILDKTSRDKLYMISRWRKQQIEEHGEETFKKNSAEVTRRGSMFHAYIASVLTGDKSSSSNTPPQISGLCKSIAHVLVDLTNVTAVEKQIFHADLGYTGFPDTLASYRGVPCVIEWKTSRKVKPTIQDCYEFPLQAAAYAGAVNCEPAVTDCPAALCSVIIVAYADGRPADVHFMDLETCETYWRQWLLRLLHYKHNLQDKPVS